MLSLLVAATLAAPASTCFRQQVVYPTHAAPVVKYVAPVQHVNVYYGVGQHVQLSALVSKQLRSDAEYQQFLRWKAEKQTQPQQAPPESTEVPQPEPSAEPLPTPHPHQPTPHPHHAQQPQPSGRVATVARTCAKCHSGPAPKGSFYLDGISPIEDISKPVEMVMTGAMPPLQGPNGEQLGTHRLTPLERYQIIEDLIRLKLLGEQ